MPGIMSPGNRRFRPALWPTLATLIILPGLLWLGLWQLDRASQKQALKGRFSIQLQQEPVELDGMSADADFQALRYRRVSGAGRYLTRHFLLDNRTHRGVAGYHVLTPFEIERGTNLGVIVNRGWVPVGISRQSLPRISVPDEVVIVNGRIRTPGESFLLGEAGYRSDVWPRVVQNLDLVQMEKALPLRLLPIVVELDPADRHGFERHWRAYGGLRPERHRAYAFQWFALSLTLVVIYVVVNFRRD